jgi:metallo-beta-lactamase class B
VIPVRENGTTHTVAYWGGNGLNADRGSLQAYVRSAQRFADVARQAGADVMMSNHTDWDGTKVYLPRLAARATGSANPYVVGAQGIQRYLEVARECATARLLRLN